jgi:DNA repair protein RAD5
MLVLNKATEEDDAESRLLDADGNEEQSLKQMIAKYAGGADDDSTNDAPGDNEYAMKVLKEIEDSEGTSECMLCTSEIFDEVLLPCYHRG